MTGIYVDENSNNVVESEESPLNVLNNVGRLEGYLQVMQEFKLL